MTFVGSFPVPPNRLCHITVLGIFELTLQTEGTMKITFAACRILLVVAGRNLGEKDSTLAITSYLLSRLHQLLFLLLQLKDIVTATEIVIVLRYMSCCHWCKLCVEVLLSLVLGRVGGVEQRVQMLCDIAGHISSWFCDQGKRSWK